MLLGIVLPERDGHERNVHGFRGYRHAVHRKERIDRSKAGGKKRLIMWCEASSCCIDSNDHHNGKEELIGENQNLSM